MSTAPPLSLIKKEAIDFINSEVTNTIMPNELTKFFPSEVDECF